MLRLCEIILDSDLHDPLHHGHRDPLHHGHRDPLHHGHRGHHHLLPCEEDQAQKNSYSILDLMKIFQFHI